MKLSIPQLVLGVQQTNLTSLFGPHLSSKAEIIPPTTPNYPSQLQQRWTDYHTASYSLGGIKPATETDVQKIVQIASSNNIPFFATGSGHGVSDFRSFDGLSIDLAAFNSVSISADKTHLTIGGAVKIHQLLTPLYEAGRELPLGSCKCVGVVGATLAGGIGGLQGHRGLMTDSLESVRMVTADGEVRHVSRRENADLFWAIRGAGSNFGIVTSATYRLPEISNQGKYMNADFLIPVGANASLWKVMESFDREMPERLAINVVLVYNRTVNEPIIAINAIYYGPQEEGEPHLAPFHALHPTRSNITMVPADTILDAAFFRSFDADNGACTPNQHINVYTMALKQIHTPSFEQFFDRLVRFWEANPDFQGRWLMQRYANQAVLGGEDTAFGHRDAKMYMNFEGFYQDHDLDTPCNSFWAPERERFARVSGYEGLQVYPGYARGDEGAEAWYGPANVRRLVEVKNKYDPRGLFSVNNPVPLVWPEDDEMVPHSGL